MDNGFSVVIAFDAADERLEALLQALTGQTIRLAKLEIILVGIGIPSGDDGIFDAWRHRYPGNFHNIHHTQDGVATAKNIGLEQATGEWITFISPPHRLAKNHFEIHDKFIQAHSEITLSLIATCSAPDHAPLVASIEDMADMPIQGAQCLFRREKLLSSGLRFDNRLRPGFEDTTLIARYLLAGVDISIGWLCLERFPGTNAPTPYSWSDESSYSPAIIHGHLSLLEEASRTGNAVPRWLQRGILRDLQHYFLTDMGERAPTRVVSEAMAVQFHAAVAKVLEYIDADVIKDFSNGPASNAAHALLSYKGMRYHSPVSVTAYDPDQKLVRLAYFVHGQPPVENFRVDGQPYQPAHAKYRACNFFRRTLYLERIVWLPATKAGSLEVLLDDKPAPLKINSLAGSSSAQHAQTSLSITLSSLHAAFPPREATKEPYWPRFRGIKARLMRHLAQLPLVRRKFAHAWVFTDRDYDADDSAEHLYRWVRSNHPDINAWFLLGRDSQDWGRLEKEGFRLVPQGWFRHLLLRNCEHVISSHADYASIGFIRQFHGGPMTWCFSFMGHGITNNDLSHWFNRKPFDLLLTSGSSEHEAITGNSTPYVFTSKEARLTGLPRHDALLAHAAQTQPESVDMITVMPTWRGSLIDEAAQGKPSQHEIETFAQSEYAQRWGTLLRSEALHQLAKTHGKRLAFMPHPDATHYLDAFDLPTHVSVMTKADISIQELFCRSALMITDYSSVAFEMAYLKRPVLYYQFDYAEYFSKGHVWREGYFSYEKDGFGPVSVEQSDLLAHLKEILKNDTKPDDKYLERMVHFFPYRDGKVCHRVFESILALKRPHSSTC